MVMNKMMAEDMTDLKVFAVNYNSASSACINKTSQELRMLSSVTLNCQATKIVMNSGS